MLSCIQNLISMKHIEEVTASCCRMIESCLGEHHDAIYIGIWVGILVVTLTTIIVRDKLRK